MKRMIKVKLTDLFYNSEIFSFLFNPVVFPQIFFCVTHYIIFINQYKVLHAGYAGGVCLFSH